MSSRSTWDLAEGDEIALGRYAVELLGGGTKYEAYLAWDDRLHALVVAKMLRPDLTDDPSALAGLAAEAEKLERLQHPVIVRGFGAVLDGERPHIVLEHLEGPKLSTLLRKFGLSIEQLLPLALQLCSAAHYMALRDVVHLDVKPRNIIMTGPPRLIDLSVAKSPDELGAIQSPIGTDAYMAPEQCVPERFSSIGPPADVWGIGVTLYEVVARGLPFPQPEVGNGAAPGRFPQVGGTPLPLPRKTPAEVADPILACLEQWPADRPTASELARELEPLVASLPRPRLGRFRA
jgi:serine/threonine protein kinase